jgi:hypothetical protein
VIPLIGIALLVVAFFAKVPGGAKWAGIVLGLIALQIFLGIFGHEVPLVGALHGINALALFSAAVFTARRAAMAEDGTPQPAM